MRNSHLPVFWVHNLLGRRVSSECPRLCRNPETKAKLKKARHSLRASAGKTGPFDDPEQNRALQESIRRSLEAAMQEMQNRRQHANHAQASEGDDTQGDQPRMTPPAQIWIDLVENDRRLADKFTAHLTVWLHCSQWQS